LSVDKYPIFRNRTFAHQTTPWSGPAGAPSQLSLFLGVFADQVDEPKPVPDTELLVNVVDLIPDPAHEDEELPLGLFFVAQAR
jgi:hypothetical protein